MDKKTIKAQKIFRHSVQASMGVAQNSKFAGFLTGKIYKGPLKNFCLPGMNCYSCPGAVGACPIGSLQAVVGTKKKFSFYVLGYLALIGVLFGRFVCGWLCLFGLIQELLYTIPTKKLKVPEKLDRCLRWLKYVFLFVLVLFLTGFVKVENGLVSVPYFCKYVCPVGMLEGGIPLVAKNADLQSSVGWRYWWKAILLAVTLASSIFIYRPFCKYICPLGAFYSIFQKFSLIRMNVDKDKCVGCGACSRQCKMGVDVVNNPNSAECIRCGECTKVCPKGALSFTVLNKKKKASSSDEQSLEIRSRKRYLSATIAVIITALAFILYINFSDASSAKNDLSATTVSFTSCDLYGNEINSEDIFSQSDVTMINVWASYCSPCAKELPELSDLNKDLAEDNIQIITILWDSDTADTEEADIAKAVIENGNVDLVCILHNSELESQLGDMIIGMPTSFLVDKNGVLLGESKANADSMDGYLDWIQSTVR